MEISQQELQLATRNHGMPLELLREPLTPLGLHYQPVDPPWNLGGYANNCVQRVVVNCHTANAASSAGSP
jgi:hypothetical protein